MRSIACFAHSRKIPPVSYRCQVTVYMCMLDHIETDAHRIYLHACAYIHPPIPIQVAN